MTREEAKKIFAELLLFGKAPCKKEELEDLCKLVLSALEQEPKTGYWISKWYAGHSFKYHKCSECNEEFSCDMETGISIDNYMYCPNCGCRMVEPQESE